jgi:hypothetical protein
MLELIKFNLKNVGNIFKQGKDSIQYRVGSLRDITKVVIPHFDKYPLITQKKADYLLFKQILDIINNKEHLTIEGIWKIVAIKASLNLGLSVELNKAFPNIVPITGPLIKNQVIPDPY